MNDLSCWLTLQRFMERYAEEKELGFSKVTTCPRNVHSVVLHVVQPVTVSSNRWERQTAVCMCRAKMGDPAV
jgi:hypothetical protein